MSILGVSAGFHDASVAVVDPAGEILFAAHSERYSKIKNDADIHRDLIAELGQWNIDHIAYYERPWLKQLRQLYSGQGIEWNKLTAGQIVKQQLCGLFKDVPISTHSHHLSHAAGGFQTSIFNRATVVVIDAVGEWDTITIWAAEYVNGQARYKKLWSQQYPHSIGLFYTAATAEVGLRPMEDEYVLMGMSAYGKPVVVSKMKTDLVSNQSLITFQQNLHTGLPSSYADYYNGVDIAASAQALCEELIYSVMQRAKQFDWSGNLVYTGGVALNCLANRRLGDYFDNIWIMPCPGDAGSSLGAAALRFGKRLHWRDAYLGSDIPGAYPVDAVVDHLYNNSIVGVASGRAEFGPRALGNRSLLADPRGHNVKDRVNEIKRRQQFRPFAPAILEEHVHDYFDIPRGWSDSRYMQIVGGCRHPDLYPAVVHVDGTSRIQTVPRDGSGIRQVLEAWHQRTGCPMLLNTSLNIRGEPMVNNRADADRFERLYNIKVCS